MNARELRSCQAIATHTAGPIRVTYRDTDRMGFAYHSQYLVWFEIGRTELLRSFGTAYRHWEDKEGVYLPVRNATVDYKLPAHYDDLVLVRTELVRLTKASITFSYHLHKDPTGELLATGSTTHAFVDSDGKILRVADRLLPQLFR